jgi:hypothetical protein
VCHKKGTTAAQKRRSSSPEFKRKKKNASLMHHYGITVHDYEAMVDAQANLCAVCGQPETRVDSRTGKVFSLSVDHDHRTGAVRQLLCKRCNAALGHVDDDPAILDALKLYLERHGNQRENQL